MKRQLTEVVLPFEGEKFLQAWQLWKNYKEAEFKFKYKSPYSEQAALNQLYKISNGNVLEAIDIIENCMGRRWEGLFKPINITKEKPTPAKEVYHQSKKKQQHVPQPEVTIDNIPIEEVAITQYEIYNAGRLRTVYIFPALYDFFIERNLIVPASGDALEKLNNEAKAFRLSILAQIANTPEQIKYYEGAKYQFSIGIIPVAEIPHVQICAKQLQVASFFKDIKSKNEDIKKVIYAK